MSKRPILDAFFEPANASEFSNELFLYALHGNRWWFRVSGSEQAVRAKIKAIRDYRVQAGKPPLAFWIKKTPDEGDA
jgi:hypothetical protein